MPIEKIIFGRNSISTDNIPMNIIMGESGIGKTQLLEKIASNKEKTEKAFSNLSPIVYIPQNVTLPILDYLVSESFVVEDVESSLILNYLHLGRLLQKDPPLLPDRLDRDMQISSSIFNYYRKELSYDEGHFLVYDKYYNEGTIESLPNSYVSGIILGRLVDNESLVEGSVLLWDNPDAGLRPLEIHKLAQFLCMLAYTGTQIFIASNNYEMIKYLEIHIASDKLFRIYNLYKSGDDPNIVEVESAHRIEDLPHQTLLEENNVLLDKIYDLK